MPTNDCHCHFFSDHFFAKLGEQAGGRQAADVVATLGWNPPGSPDQLADRWADELDRHGVARAALIASIPGDEESVARAVARHQSRFVGFAMVDPTGADSLSRLDRYLRDRSIRCICLFPAMHRYSLRDERARAVLDLAVRNPGTAIFVHCGALSVGVRRKLGLASRFDVSYGNPLDVQAAAAEFSQLPFIIPHFGAGFLREALVAADLCPNVFLDTSSSNKWIAYHPGLMLEDVFRHAVDVAGTERLLFGTDSSFFPRGWNKTVHDAQVAALEKAGVDAPGRDRIFGANFDRLFPPPVLS